MRSRKNALRLPWLEMAVVGVAFCVLVLERRRPLRSAKEPALRRDTRNLVIAAIAAGCVGMVQPHVVAPLTELVERRGIGLLKVVQLPRAVEVVQGIALMDYTLYAWHYLTHEVDLLWRFHEAHHTDRDLSATTGIRFHFGEMLLSMPFRAAQVIVLGVSPRTFSAWQTLTTMQILFHHSNVRLPIAFERRLSAVIVTPRLHGIHHSTVRREADSNWGTIFSVFDRLHGTLRCDVPQGDITIGVPAFDTAEAVTLWNTLALPFRRALDRWTRPGQPAPARELLAVR